MKRQIDYLTIYTGGYMSNSKGHKVQGSWHKADWERLRAWGKGQTEFKDGFWLQG